MLTTPKNPGTEPVPMPMPELESDSQPVPMPMPEFEEDGIQDSAPMIAEGGMSEMAIFIYPDDCSPLKWWSPVRPLADVSGDALAEVNIDIGTVNIHIDNTEPVYLVPPEFDETLDPIPEFVEA